MSNAASASPIFALSERMPRSPSDTTSDPAADSASASPKRRAATSAQRSRIGAAWVGGYFDPAVSLGLKMLALKEGTTVQALIGRALNDRLESHGLGRPASETVLPRGAAAWRRDPPGS